MIKFEIDENTAEGRELIKTIHKHPRSARRIPIIKNGIPKGYLTAEEWKDETLKMVDEVFDKHEKGLL